MLDSTFKTLVLKYHYFKPSLPFLNLTFLLRILKIQLIISEP